MRTPMFRPCEGCGEGLTVQRLCPACFDAQYADFLQKLPAYEPVLWLVDGGW